MKPTTTFPLISLFFFLFSSFGFAQGTLLVADFSDMTLKNNLGGNIIAWKVDPDDASQQCEVSYSNISHEGLGHSLKIDYNIATNKETYLDSSSRVSPQELGLHSDAFGGIAIELMGANLKSYKYLNFFAKGDEKSGFPGKFKLELIDKKRAAPFIFEGLTSSWKKFSIPLSHFSSIIDINEVQVIMLVFDKNTDRKKGTFYLDNVYFSRSRKDALSLQALGDPVPKSDQSADLKKSFSEAPSSHVSKKSQPIEIDGDLKDWSGQSTFELVHKKNLESGSISNDGDLSSKVFFKWDELYLYFAASVRDNEIICDSEASERLYEWDSVELYIDPEKNGLVWGKSSDYQLGFSPTAPSGKPDSYAWFQNKKPSSDEVKFASKLNENGYEIESAISWKFLSLNPSVSRSFAVSVAVHDVDQDETDEGKMIWYFRKDHKTPNNHWLGTIELGN